MVKRTRGPKADVGSQGSAKLRRPCITRLHVKVTFNEFLHSTASSLYHYQMELLTLVRGKNDA